MAPAAIVKSVNQPRAYHAAITNLAEKVRELDVSESHCKWHLLLAEFIKFPYTVVELFTDLMCFDYYLRDLDDTHKSIRSIVMPILNEVYEVMSEDVVTLESPPSDPGFFIKVPFTQLQIGQLIGAIKLLSNSSKDPKMQMQLLNCATGMITTWRFLKSVSDNTSHPLSDEQVQVMTEVLKEDLQVNWRAQNGILKNFVINDLYHRSNKIKKQYLEFCEATEDEDWKVPSFESFYYWLIAVHDALANL